MKLWFIIASAAFLVSQEVHGLSFSVQVLKSCRRGQCVAGSNGVVNLAVTTGQLGNTPCAAQPALGLCPNAPSFDIASKIRYTLILLGAKANAPPNYNFTVPLTCNNGTISGTLNTRISGFYKVQAIAFYNKENPAEPGLLETVGCINQPTEEDPMIVQIMPGAQLSFGSFFKMLISLCAAADNLNVSQTFNNVAKLTRRNNYLSPSRIIVQMSDSYGNPKVSQLNRARFYTAQCLQPG